MSGAFVATELVGSKKRKAFCLFGAMTNGLRMAFSADFCATGKLDHIQAVAWKEFGVNISKIKFYFLKLQSSQARAYCVVGFNVKRP